MNSKYKTKECGTFCNEAYCRFGDRCNFIHENPITNDVKSDEAIRK